MFVLLYGDGMNIDGLKSEHDWIKIRELKESAWNTSDATIVRMST